MNQFDFSLHGLEHQLSIDSVADTLGQDASANGFSSNAVYLFVGKISGNGTAANTLQASLFASGSVVADFTEPNFQWMLTAQSGATFNPIITDVQFISPDEANYTISNIWIGSAAMMLPPTLTSLGDFNHDGHVDAADYVVWRKSFGMTGSNLGADANGDYQVDARDLNSWRAHMGETVSAAGAGVVSGSSGPEPRLLALLLTGVIAAAANRGARAHYLAAV